MSTESTLERALQSEIQKPSSFGGGGALYGNPGAYDRSTSKWDLYEERFNAYLAVNRIVDEIDKINLLITTIGDDTYETLRDLVQPRKPFDSSYAELIGILRAHFKPKTFKEFERSKLFTTEQHPHQSIKEYVEELRKIANNCEYEHETDIRSSAILTAFINGIENDEIRAKLVLETNLTLDLAQSIAESITNAAAGKGDSSECGTKKKQQYCRKCNRSNHSDANCWFQIGGGGQAKRRRADAADD